MNPEIIAKIIALQTQLVELFAASNAPRVAPVVPVTPAAPVVVENPAPISVSIKAANDARAEFNKVAQVVMPRRYGRTSKAERLSFYYFWSNGIPQNEIAAKYDTTQGTVCFWCKKLRNK